MSVIVRSPHRDEIYRAAEIGKIAFGTPEIEPWLGAYTWIADHVGLEHLIVVEANGELVASLVCSPGWARFCEDVVPLCAVGGVATLPEHRRHGYAGMMMEEAVRLLFRKGYHTSALWPFSYAYYRKFGWEVGSEHRRYVCSTEFTSGLSSPEGVRPALKSDLPAVSALIDRFARRHNCVTVRDGAWWDCIRTIHRYDYGGTDDPATCLAPWVHEADGEIDGYAFYRIEGDGEQARVEIKELVADNRQARLALLNRISEAGPSSLAFYAPVDDDFLQDLSDPRQVKTELHPGFQFRVINPPAALELRTVDPSLDITLAFSISDPVLTAFYFSVKTADGKIVTSRELSGSQLSMDIRTFSQLYSGYITPSRAYELGKIEAASKKAVNLADKLFRCHVPFRSMLELG
jgi:predicted acetyltransferase